jgi:small multidrug resistance pump
LALGSLVNVTGRVARRSEFVPGTETDFGQIVGESEDAVLVMILNTNYMYLGVAILAEVIATSLLKSSDGMAKLWPTLASIAGYVVAFFFLSMTLRAIPTGIAYGIWSGVGIVLVSAVSWIWFKQSLDGPALAGMGMIIAGVVTINVFSKSVAH